MTLRLLGVLLTVLVIFAVLSGCRSSRRDGGRDGVTDDGLVPREKLSNSEVEKRLEETFLDLDSAANLGELFNLIADGLSIEIVVETDRIAPDTPVELSSSKSSLVAQILEYVCAAKGTRYEIRKGKVWILDAK